MFRRKEQQDRKPVSLEQCSWQTSPISRTFGFFRLFLTFHYYLFIKFLNWSIVHLASLAAQMVKNLPAMQETWVQSLGWEGPLREGHWQPTPGFLGFPGGSDGKEFACNTGYPGSIPGLGRSPGEGNGNPLQYSFLEKSMDRGAWWAI